MGLSWERGEGSQPGRGLGLKVGKGPGSSWWSDKGQEMWGYRERGTLKELGLFPYLDYS